MSDFSSNDILQAKRRVEEMRRRASIPEDTPPEQPPPDRAETVLAISNALDSLLQNDKRDVLLAALLRLAGDREEDVLLLTLLGILLQ